MISSNFTDLDTPTILVVLYQYFKKFERGKGKELRKDAKNQSTITDSMNPVRKYDIQSQRQVSLTRKLSLCIRGTNLPLSSIEH